MHWAQLGAQHCHNASTTQQRTCFSHLNLLSVAFSEYLPVPSYRCTPQAVCLLGPKPCCFPACEATHTHQYAVSDSATPFSGRTLQRDPLLVHDAHAGLSQLGAWTREHLLQRICCCYCEGLGQPIAPSLLIQHDTELALFSQGLQGIRASNMLAAEEDLQDPVGEVKGQPRHRQNCSEF